VLKAANVVYGRPAPDLAEDKKKGGRPRGGLVEEEYEGPRAKGKSEGTSIPRSDFGVGEGKILVGKNRAELRIWAGGQRKNELAGNER